MKIRALVLAVGLVASACTATPSASTVLESSTTSTSLASTTSIPPTTTTTTAAPTTTPATVEVPPGFTSAALGETGLQIGLPDAFTAVDITDEDAVDLLLAAGEEIDSDLFSAVLEGAASSQFEFAFWAFDFENSTFAFVPTFNVLCLERGPFDKVEVYEAIVASQLESVGFSDISVERLETRAGSTVLISSIAPEEVGAYNTTQLFVPLDETSCTLSFAYDDQGDVYVDELRASLGTLEPVG